MTQRHWSASYGSIPGDTDADRYVSVNALLEMAMERFHGKPAFHGSGQTLTFADVQQMSSDFAAYLQKEADLRKGDRVAVMLPNVLAFPVAFVGIAQAGGVQVNVNPQYTARELQHQIEDSGAEIVVIHESALQVLAEIVHKTRIRRVVIVPADGLRAHEPDAAPAMSLRWGRAVTLPAAIAQGSVLSFDAVEVRGEDLLLLQYTGGTTGPSRGAALSHRNLMANIEQFRAFTPEALREGEGVVVTAIPLHHIFALMVNFLSCFTAGAQNWLVENPKDMNGLIDVLKTARPIVFITVDGYFRTGDIAAFDDQGFLKIVDRMKDMIVVSGFNVYPDEVEAVAAGCEGVVECACIGVPDARTGEAVMLMVVAASGDRLSVDRLLGHCRAELATYKVPKYLRLVEELPKSPVGKILRCELRRLAGSETLSGDGAVDLIASSSGRAANADARPKSAQRDATDFAREPGRVVNALKSEPLLSLAERRAINGDARFASLSPAVRHDLLSRSVVRRYANRQPIHARGSAQATLDVVARGAVRISPPSIDDTAPTLAYLPQGNWFADMGALDFSRRIHCAYACGRTTVLSVEGENLLALLHRHRELHDAVSQLRQSLAFKLFDSLHDLVTLPLRTRLANCLMRLCADFGTGDPRGGPVRIGMALTQEALARMVGASRQRINTEIKRLERQGILRTGIELVVLDCAALTELSSFHCPQEKAAMNDDPIWRHLDERAGAF